jgi:signal transduction histidine kinase
VSDGPRPLDFLGSIKAKLGVVVVATVALTVLLIFGGFKAGIPLRYTTPVAAVVGLIVIQLLAHGMVAPLREMATASKDMAGGDYQRRVRATSRDEVGELARAFNAMATELAEVDRMRRDLVANVSHELRTPISALQAKLENLVDGVEQPDPESLGVMLNQVERLGRMVSQLLDLSRLESGAIPLERRPFEVASVLEMAASESRLNAGRVTVSVEAQSTGLVADGDPERVHQVVANLVDNAVRYSPAGGTVTIAAHRDAGRVAIEVSDEGPGIPEQEASRVFERFYRADPSRSGHGGAGLGLAIARWIVDLHGGEIRAEARQPKGCRMVVLLPGARA